MFENGNHKKIVLKRGREKSLLRRHPWVFSGAVESVNGEPTCGDTVMVCDADGRFLAFAAFSPLSQIQARVWSWQEQENIDSHFFFKQISQAVERRRNLPSVVNTNAARLIHAESDGLAGVIVDQYADVLVLQCLTCGAERWRDVIADHLMEICAVSGIYERSDADVRSLEGLSRRACVLRGKVPDRQISIFEGDLHFVVDIFEGHKSGFYLDQRNNRALISKIADGRKVLDCFCYSGGFSLAALLGGANAVSAIDSSAAALQMAKKNLLLNHIGEEKICYHEADVFHFLRSLRDRNEQFDLIILDPPKFAPTISQVERAARGYKDINLLAFKLLRKRGLLVTFSCSGGVSAELFQKIVAGAALDAQVQAQILYHLSQSSDHPIGLAFPEGEYLKGLVLGVI